MRAADTNLLVRLIVRDDPAQVAAAEAFIKPGVWVSHLALAECVWVLSTAYSFPPSQIVVVVDALLDHASLTLQDREVVEAALERYRRRPSVGFSDCLMLEITRKAGHLPLGTFDRDLGKLEGAQRLQ